MDRRTVLRGGLLVGVTGLAGCQNLLGSGKSADQRDGPTDSPSTDGANGSDDGGIRSVFERQYSVSDGVGAFEDVAVLDGEGYVLVGTQTTPGGGSRGWITRTDSEGQARWSNTYGSGATHLRGVTTTSDGDVLAVGRTGSRNQRTRGWALELSPDGRERWSQSYDAATDPILQAGTTTSNGYLLAGIHEMTEQGGGTGWVLSIDAEGTVIDERVFESGYYRLFNDVVQTGRDEYVLVGSASDRSDGTSSGYLVGIDADRNTRFERQLSDAEQNVFRGGVARADGSVVCCGETSPRDDQHDASEDAWLVAVDSTGSERWSTTHDEQNGDRLWDVAADDDGSILCVGQTNVTGQGTQTGLVLSVAADGAVQSSRTVGDLRVDTDPLAALTGVAADGDGTYVASGLENVRQTESGSFEGQGWLLKLDA